MFRCALHGHKHESRATVPFSVALALLLLWALPSSCEPTVFHERVSGAVGAGNYSYYTLSKPGAVTILVHPLAGDPDLYVAERNVQPTFDLDSHCMQSTTCGHERVDLPRTFGRPVGIGIYGHPSHELSLYELEVRVDDSTENLLFYDYGYVASHQPDSHHHYNSPTVHEEEVDDSGPSEEISLLWTFLLGLLKILLEILQG